MKAVLALLELADAPSILSVEMLTKNHSPHYYGFCDVDLAHLPYLVTRHRRQIIFLFSPSGQYLTMTKANAVHNLALCN